MADRPFRKRARAAQEERERPSSSSSAVPRRKGHLWGIVPTFAEWQAALPALGLAIASAILLRLAYRPLYWSPLAFVALVPLFWGLRRCRPGVAFYVGWLFGSIMCWFGTGWFVIVDRFNPYIWLGVLPLAMALGLYFAFTSALIVHFARKLSPWIALLSAMMTWAGIEYFMSIGPLGTPYGLAQSQGGWLAVAQVASLGGMPLLSALILGTNLSAMETIAAFSARYGQFGALTRVGTMVALVIAAHVWGTSAINDTEGALTTEPTISLRVALMQPNVPQEKKYQSYMAEDPKERARLQDELTMTQLTQLRSMERKEVDLIVTPESTFTQSLIDIEEHVQNSSFGRAVMREVMELATDLRTPIVLCAEDNFFQTAEGEYTEEALKGLDPKTGAFYPGASAYGGLWMVRPGENQIRPVADYRKLQLMPFGEAVPYFNIIPGFQEKIVQVGTFARGELGPPVGFTVEDRLDAQEKEVRVGPSICFEDQFPYIHLHHARNGANLFVNVTNDGWFDGSSGPGWHAEMARWRSIETGIPMVRCTNSGLTEVISATGVVTESLPAMEPGILKADLKILAIPPKTVYTRIGNLFGIASFAGLLLMLGAGVVAGRTKKQEA